MALKEQGGFFWLEFDTNRMRFAKRLDANQQTVWESTDITGRIYRFGADPQSRVQLPGGTVRWSLTDIKDLTGNVISFTYRTDSSVQYPTEIRYSTASNLPSTFRVRFDWEDRPDPIRRFQATRPV